MPDCIFCKIAKKEEKTEIIYEDDETVAFKDIYPKAPFHLLIVPKRHIESVATLRDEDKETVSHLIFVAKKIAEEKLQINLAISLHAPDNELRSKLMPINKTYSIEKVLNAVDDYISKTRRRVMFEYIMIKDVNDSEEQAKKLAELMKKYLYFVNLISYNPARPYPPISGEGGPTEVFIPSSPLKIKKFKEILEKEGVAVTQRYSFGQDIKGACGQLAAKNKELC